MNRAQTAGEVELLNFRTTLPGVCSILNLNYRTAQVWCRHYRLAGRRGRLRYGLTDMLLFELVSKLSNSGFSKKQIQAARSAIGSMIKADPDHDRMFIVTPSAPDDCNIHAFTFENFLKAVTLLRENGTMYSAFSLWGAASEVLERVRCFRQSKPYVGAGERVKAALLELAAEKKREALIRE